MSNPVLDYHQPPTRRSHAKMILLDFVVLLSAYVPPIILTYSRHFLAGMIGFKWYAWNEEIFLNYLNVAPSVFAVLTVLSILPLGAFGRVLPWNVHTDGDNGLRLTVCHIVWFVHFMSAIARRFGHGHYGNRMSIYVLWASLIIAVGFHLFCALASSFRVKRSE